MKLLLDTHTFMWFVDGNEKLHEYARSLIENERNERLLSVGSLWEMAIFDQYPITRLWSG